MDDDRSSETNVLQCRPKSDATGQSDYRGVIIFSFLTIFLAWGIFRALPMIRGESRQSREVQSGSSAVAQTASQRYWSETCKIESSYANLPTIDEDAYLKDKKFLELKGEVEKRAQSCKRLAAELRSIQVAGVRATVSFPL